MSAIVRSQDKSSRRRQGKEARHPVARATRLAQRDRHALRGQADSKRCAIIYATSLTSGTHRRSRAHPTREFTARRGLDPEVRFQYRKVDSNRVRTMALPILAFMHRFLQHVLPTGFMKVRYYGFLSPSFSTPLEEVAARIELAQGFAARAPDAQIQTPAPLCCRHCGGVLRYLRVICRERSRRSELGQCGGAQCHRQ